MRSTRLTKKLLGAAGMAVLLIGSPASAHLNSHTVTFSASTYALSANATYTSSLTFGAYEADSLVVDLPAGIKLAHDDQHGNELASNPNDEADIGGGSTYANFVFFLCNGGSNVSLDVSWEEDMTGAPANAVAHYEIVAASIGTYHGWAIEQNDANDDYKITVDLDAAWTCSTQPSTANVSLTINGTATGGVVSQNPSVSGCYTSVATFVDVSGTNHSGSAGRNFSAGTTC